MSAGCALCVLEVRIMHVYWCKGLLGVYCEYIFGCKELVCIGCALCIFGV